MSIGLLFWVVWIIAFLFGGYLNWPFDRRSTPSFVIVMVLIGLLGWGIFGPLLHR